MQATQDAFQSLPLPFQRFHALHFPSHTNQHQLHTPPHVAFLHSWFLHTSNLNFPSVNGEDSETHKDAWLYANGEAREGRLDESNAEEHEEGAEEENVQIDLTEEMIEMFKHSEDWKRERATILEQERLEEQNQLRQERESESLIIESKRLATPTSEELYGRRNREAIVAKENYLNWIRVLDSEEDGKWSAKSQSKRIVWPVLPIRC